LQEQQQLGKQLFAVTLENRRFHYWLRKYLDPQNVQEQLINCKKQSATGVKPRYNQQQEINRLHTELCMTCTSTLAKASVLFFCFKKCSKLQHFTPKSEPQM